MTKPNRTHIAIVLDRSASMEQSLRGTIDGYNDFIKEQRTVPDDEATMTLVQFNHMVEVFNRDPLPIEKAPLLDEVNYRPAGNTALYDAVGYTVIKEGRYLSSLPEHERPSKVVVVIITDGLENASRVFRLDRVRELVEQQQSVYKWQFVFIGADLSTLEQGGEISVLRDRAMRMSKSSQGAKGMFLGLSKNFTEYRSTGVSSELDWDDDQRAEALGEEVQEAFRRSTDVRAADSVRGDDAA